jgi:ABC-2 type transport system ATP-binding protein
MLVRPDRGTVAAFGHDLRSAGRSLLGRIGFVFEEPDIDARLTVDGHLRYRAGLLGVARSDGRRLAARALDRFGLAERAEDRAGVLSQVDRRQLALAGAIVGAPALVVADRSADGLEPDERSAVLDPLLRLRSEEGTAIVLATGEPDVAAAADRVAVLHRGRIVFDGTREAFVAAGSGDAAASLATLIRGASAETAEA